MEIRPNFNRQDIEARFKKFFEVVEKRQIERLQMLGEKCVKHARLIPASSGFTDQTGNLRSSIGYIVFKDGKAIHENYEIVKQGSEGMKQGKELAEKTAMKHPKGLLLVVTAGMDYALELEAKGRDVLTSAEHLAAQELPKMLKALKENINQAI